jgi:hypothetical protein
MPAPLKPHLYPVVLHDEDAVPVGTASNPLIVNVGGGGSGVVITGLTQVQTPETVTPLDPSETFNGADHDCENYESFGVSIYVKAGVGSLNATVLVENSSDGVTWRTVDTVSLAGAVGAEAQLNRVYSVTRQFYRVSVTNNDNTNALDETEVVSMLKPV